MSVQYQDIGDDYFYPNARSYSGMRDGVNKLVKGSILSRIGVTSAIGVYAPGYSPPTPSPFLGGSSAQWLSKTFQFNPSEIDLDFVGVATDPPSSQQQGGNAPNSALGAINLGVNMLFHREQEVYTATKRGTSTVSFTPGSGVSVTPTNSRLSYPEQEIYRRIGVQKDIYDLFRVILANEADGLTTDQALPSDMTMGALTGKAFDLSTAGSNFIMRNIVIRLNDDLAFFGVLSGMSISFKKFNSNMVPVWAEVQLQMSCMSTRPVNGLANVAATGFSATRTGTPTSGSSSSASNGSLAPYTNNSTTSSPSAAPSTPAPVSWSYPR